MASAEGGRFTVELEVGENGRSSSALDFSIRGGREHGIPIVVSAVEAGGKAAARGMDIGCEILAVGDISLEDASHAEAVALLTAPRTGALRLALRRNRVLRKAFLEQKRERERFQQEFPATIDLVGDKFAPRQLSPATTLSTEPPANRAEIDSNADDASSQGSDIDVDAVLQRMEKKAAAASSFPPPPQAAGQESEKKKMPRSKSGGTPVKRMLPVPPTFSAALLSAEDTANSRRPHPRADTGSTTLSLSSSVAETTSFHEGNSSPGSSVAPADLRNLAEHMRTVQLVHEQAALHSRRQGGGARGAGTFYSLPASGFSAAQLMGPNGSGDVRVAHDSSHGGISPAATDETVAMQLQGKQPDRRSGSQTRLSGFLSGVRRSPDGRSKEGALFHGAENGRHATPAVRLGMPPPNLKFDAPLPANWLERMDDRTGRKYYVNLITKVTTWLRPREPQHQHTRNPDRVDWTALPYGWERGINASGQTYYINHIDKSNTWDHPRVALLKVHCKIGEQIYNDHMMHLKELEGTLNAKCNTVSDRQIALDRLRQRRVGFMTTLKSAGNSGAAKIIDAKLEMLDEQIEEAAKDMLSAVEQVDADERAITLRKRLLAAVNRLLVGCAKSATLLSPTKSAGLARKLAALHKQILGQSDLAVELLGLVEDFRKQVFVLTGLSQSYKPAAFEPTRLTQREPQAPHLRDDGELKSDLEMALDHHILADVLQPALAATIARLQQLWDQLQSHHDTLHGWAANNEVICDHPPWLRQLLADISNADMAAYAADLVACQPLQSELEAGFHLACMGLAVHADRRARGARLKNSRAEMIFDEAGF